MALAAPISTNDTEGVRLLLEAGADPHRYADDADSPAPAVYAAVRSGCSAELTGLPSRIVRTRLPLRGVRVCLALGAVWARLPVLAEIGWPGGPAGRGVPRC